MADSYAILDGVPLPCHFKYTPLIPKKRVAFLETAAGMVVQRSTVLDSGVGEIPFTLGPATSDEVKILCDAASAGTVVFSGYWGEEYQVEVMLNSPEVNGGFHFMSGTFVVVCTITPYCTPTNC